MNKTTTIIAGALLATITLSSAQDYDPVLERTLQQNQRQHEHWQQRLEAQQRQQEIIQEMQWQELRQQQREENRDHNYFDLDL